MTQPWMRWNISLEKWNIMPLRSNVTLFCVIFCSRCFLSFTRCLYSEFRKNHSVSCIRCVSMAQGGCRILKREKEMQKLGPFLDLFFYFNPKKLFDNNTGRKVTIIYPGNMCFCVFFYIYIYIRQCWRKIHDKLQWIA